MDIVLSAFSYRNMHVSGGENVVADDILTQWIILYRDNPRTVCSRARVPTAPTPNEKNWPDRNTSLDAQRCETTPDGVVMYKDGLLRISGRVWIPEAADKLQLRLMIIAHGGEILHLEKKKRPSYGKKSSNGRGFERG